MFELLAGFVCMLGIIFITSGNFELFRKIKQWYKRTKRTNRSYRRVIGNINIFIYQERIDQPVVPYSRLLSRRVWLYGNNDILSQFDYLNYVWRNFLSNFKCSYCNQSFWLFVFRLQFGLWIICLSFCWYLWWVYLRWKTKYVKWT